MRYEDYGRDKAKEQIAHSFREEDRLSREQIVNHLKDPSSLLDTLPDEENIQTSIKFHHSFLDNISDDMLVEISYTLDELEKIDYRIYSFISDAIDELKLLELSEIYAKDFDREIEALKTKVDYLSKLSEEPITIHLPISLASIKSGFYGDCIVHLDMPSKVISELFKTVFKNKVYKGDIELYRSIDKEKYQKFESFINKKIDVSLSEHLAPNRYYTNNK